MKLQKSLFAIPSVLILAAPIGAEIIERVVAKVNGDIVTLSEFEGRQVAAVQAARLAPSQIEAYLHDNNARILQEAIDDLLVVQRAGELGMKMRPDYIKEVIEGIKKDNKIESDEVFQEQLKREGMTLDDLKRNIERSILKRQVLAREVEPKMSANDADARADYEAHLADYTKPATVHLQEIVVGARDGREAEEVVREVLGRARGGEDFEALAKTYSIASTRTHGGDLGELRTADVSPEIKKAATGLAAGAISEPLPVPDGFRILKVVKKTAESVTTFDEAKADILKKLNQQRSTEEYDRYLEGLRKSAIIDLKVREVPLNVSTPVAGPLRESGTADPTKPAAAPAEDQEIVTSPQAAPEHIAPPPLPEAAPKKPVPSPTPPPASPRT